MPTIRYTTRGAVRGACGHRHRSIAAAHACLERDCRACRGCSDRSVVALDGDVERDLDEIEAGELQYLCR